MGINVYPRYYRHPKYFGQQIIKYEDVEDRSAYRGLPYERGISDCHSRNSGIFLCPDCDTVFEQFQAFSGGNRLRYTYLPNTFPRLGLAKRVCDQCKEAKLTFDIKMGEGHLPVNKKNIKKLIGKGDLPERGDFKVRHGGK